MGLSWQSICPTVTKSLCKPRKKGQNILVFKNRYHLSDSIRKILIPSDKCSVDISDAGIRTIVPNQYN